MLRSGRKLGVEALIALHGAEMISSARHQLTTINFGRMIVRTVCSAWRRYSWSRKILIRRINRSSSTNRIFFFFFHYWNTGNPQETRKLRLVRHLWWNVIANALPLSLSLSLSWNFESGIPETELPFSSFHSTPKGIGGLEEWGEERKKIRGERAL